MTKKSSYFINGITMYRIMAAPMLFILIFNGSIDIFKWLLGISFLTDAIDGYLARRYKVTSIFGARLDSIGDDLTIIAAVTGLFFFKAEFIGKELWVLISLLALYVMQNVYALISYGKTTSYHTYLAKIAAVFQGVFLLLVFFFESPNYYLFYSAAILTGLDLLEEIILIKVLPKWEVNVKGLYWVMKR